MLGASRSHNTRARGSGAITIRPSPKLLPHHVSAFDHGDVPPTQLREPASRYAKLTSPRKSIQSFIPKFLTAIDEWLPSVRRVTACAAGRIMSLVLPSSLSIAHIDGIFRHQPNVTCFTDLIDHSVYRPPISASVCCRFLQDRHPPQRFSTAFSVLMSSLLISLSSLVKAFSTTYSVFELQSPVTPLSSTPTFFDH